MSNGLYLILVYTLIPLAVIVIAVAGRPLLTFPHRLTPRLSEDTAYTWGVAAVAVIGLALMLGLGLSLAFTSGGAAFPPVALLGVNLPTLFALLLLFGVPLAVAGLIASGKRLLAHSRPPAPGRISAETVYALGVAAALNLGALAEVWLMVQLASL